MICFSRATPSEVLFVTSEHGLLKEKFESVAVEIMFWVAELCEPVRLLVGRDVADLCDCSHTGPVRTNNYVGRYFGALVYEHPLADNEIILVCNSGKIVRLLVENLFND